MAKPLTDEETRKLRAFHRQVDRLRKSTIGQQRKVQVATATHFNLVAGEITTSSSGYDPEAFQSQLPLLRQFVLNDPVNFGHICNIIFQCCDRQELLAWVKEARKRWNEILAEVPEALHQHLHQATSSLEEALEKLFYGYGGLFHVNIDAPEEEQSVAAVEQALLHRSFPKMCRCLNVLDSVIYWWLDEPTKPVPPVPTK
jgi:hypothetical protein